MSADPARLWQPVADDALRVWSEQFETRKLELIRAAPGNIHDPKTAIAIGAEAKRLFDLVGKQVLKQVRDLLNRSDNLDEIGTPEQAAQILIDPLERKAREAIASLQHQIKTQKLALTGLPDAQLAHTKDELQAAAATLTPRLQTEVRLRRVQIEQTAQSATQRSTNERWQRWHHMASVAKVLIPIATFLLGYVAGKINLLTRVLQYFGLSGDGSSSGY